MDNHDIQFINTGPALTNLCEQLRHSEWIVLDTEFMRENTYYPQLCLLQVATPTITACVDPLAIDTLEPLLDIIYNPNITKVMHACSQDMEIFFHLRGELPLNVFDTQVAAPLLGFPIQMGYARLVEDMLGIKLDKTHTRTDWSRRPLSPEQLRYAADDVLYLAQLYTQLLEQLKSRGRLEWLTEDFARLSDAGPYSKPPQDAWQRIKGANRLRGHRLSVLQVLATWREQAARDNDKPRSWLMRDDVLLDMARQRPRSADDLSHIRGLNERTARKYGEQLLRLIGEAPSKPAQQPPAMTRPTALTSEQEAMTDILMAVVRQRAAEQSLSAAALASRKDLEQLICGNNKPGILCGWKAAIIGRELESILSGETTLYIKGGKLEIKHS